MDLSDADEEFTKRLAEAGKMLGIELQDHIIFDRGEKYYSFKTEGKI